MAVKIRLSRRGRKKLAIYDIIVADARAPRDGSFIEKIGSYNPNTDPTTVVLKSDRAVDWLLKGAQPTDTARSILSHEGVMLKKHLKVGVIKGTISQEQADAKFEDWKQGKESRKQGSADSKSQLKDDAKQARLDAEKKVNEARALAIAKKNKVEEPIVEDISIVNEKAAEPIHSPYSISENTNQIPHFEELWDSIAKDIFLEKYDFLQWLLTPNNVINQEKPLMLLADGGDFGLLKRLLGRLEHGIMA